MPLQVFQTKGREKVGPQAAVSSLYGVLMDGIGLMTVCLSIYHHGARNPCGFAKAVREATVCGLMLG